jgi:GGDEF domain-containing protein
MLSSSLSELLERARTRFGLEVEVLDATLQHVYPDSTTPLTRMIEQSPVVRQSLLNALADGRPEQLTDDDVHYQVFPLRRAAKLRQASALVAVRRPERKIESVEDDRAWPELARAIVEADFAASEALTDERQQSRRLLATLRFLRHLVETDTEADLAEATVQAAAVWFDVDPRIFERDLAGEFTLRTALPGAHVEESARHLSQHWFADAREPVRVGPMADWGQAVGGSEVVLVPLAVTDKPDWVLALIGAFPQDAESLFAILGRIVGVQLETIRSRRRDRTRERFHSLVEQGGKVSELVAVRLIRELADLTGASYASLVVHRSGRERRVVCIGTSTEVPGTAEASATDRSTPSQFICRLPLGGDSFAVLDLRPVAGGAFQPDAELITRVATRVVQSWLVGAEPSLQDVTREASRPAVSEFVRRIEEELERAKRFDLRLSLVLIDIPGTVASVADAASLMRETVRQELRGSDVLGTMNGDRVAVILTHTDGVGSHKVVGRLRRRLGETATRLNLPGVRVGHAAFSADCRTAEALVLQAARDAQPVSL